MRTIEIARNDWVPWLNQFTQVHDRWLVSVEVLRPDLGAQVELDTLPLIGISADRIDHDGTIAISVARARALHFTHVIHAVKRIFVEQTDTGADAALQFEAQDGSRTVVRFRVAALPETVDGVPRR